MPVKVKKVKRNVSRRSARTTVVRINPRSRNRANKFTVTSFGHEFAHCVLNPFGHRIPSHIPDGTASQLISFENRTYFSYTPAKKNCFLIILPTLGNNLFYYESDTIWTSGISNGLYGMTVVPSNYSPVVLRANLERFRTVSMAAIITPTGPVVSRGGIAVGAVSPTDSGLEPVDSGAALTNGWVALGGTSSNPPVLAQGVNGFNGSLAEPMYMTSVRQKYPASFHNVTGDNVYLGGSNPGNSPTMAIDATATATITGATAIGGMDLDYPCIILQMNALSVGMSFVIDVVHCFEATTYQASLMTPMAIGGAKLNQRALDLVSDTSRIMPRGFNFRDLGDLTLKIGRYIGAAAGSPAGKAMLGALGRMSGVPYLAGLSSITKGAGQLAISY